MGQHQRGMASCQCTAHIQTTSGVGYHHRSYVAYMVVLREVWHVIISIGQNTRLKDVDRGMQPSPLDSTQGRTTSDVACHHCPLTKNTIGRRRAWHAIIAHGLHKLLDNVRRGKPIVALGSINCRMTSGVTCHHRCWAPHMIG